MKHLIIYAHLNKESFTQAIVDKLISVSESKDDEIKTIDLYADKFEPVLEYRDIEYQFMDKQPSKDVANYQEMISWADNITIVYPLWWAQMPAILKGFFDRVFANGFAYKVEDKNVKPLLTGKTAKVYISIGNPKEDYQENGMLKAMKVANEEGIFRFCGMKSSSIFFCGISTSSDDERQGFLDSII